MTISTPRFSFTFLMKTWKEHGLRVMMDLKLIETSGLGKKKQTGPENGDARWWLNWAVFSWTLLRQTGHWGLMKTVCALERKKKKLLVGCEKDVCLEPCSCRNACSSCLSAGWLLTVYRFIKSSLSQFKPAWMPKECPYFSHCGLYSSTASLPSAPDSVTHVRINPGWK